MPDRKHYSINHTRFQILLRFSALHSYSPAQPSCLRTYIYGVLGCTVLAFSGKLHVMLIVTVLHYSIETQYAMTFRFIRSRPV